MRSLRTKWFHGAVGVLTVVLILSGAADASTAHRRINPGRWARAVCGQFIKYNAKIDEIGEDLADIGKKLEAGGLKPIKAKQRFERAYREMVDATDRLIKKYQAIDLPNSYDAPPTLRASLRTLRDQRQEIEKARRRFSLLSTRNTEAFIEEGKRITTQRADVLIEIGSPFEDLEQVPDLAIALDDEDACSDLLSGFVATALDVGDCVNSTEDTFLDDLIAIPCGGQHNGEVFVVTKEPTPLRERFPGTAYFEGLIEQTCTPAFTAYLGIDYQLSEYDYTYFYPSIETWNVGDREVVCIVEKEDASQFTGSVKGSAK